MVDDIKLLVFRGTGLEDLHQHWFQCEDVRNVKQVTYDNVKMAQLTTMFRDRALNWFMKYSHGKMRTFAEVRVALSSEFKKPKSESQCITEPKEIKQKPTESVWEFDQKFKTLLDQVSFDITLQQDQEWFITALLPHIRLSLMQQKVASQAEALEIAMKLEASPIAETSARMTQIQNQLAQLTLQLHDIKKGKEVQEIVWCTKCRTKGHSKEHCSLFVEYLASGTPDPLPQARGPWCEICRTNGHRPQDYHLLKKYVQTPKSLFCTFCKSVGHDENNCRAYELMMERTRDVYAMQSDQQNNAGTAQYDQGRAGHGGFRGQGRGG